MALSVKQIRFIGILFFVLTSALLIASVATPRWVVVSASVSPSNGPSSPVDIADAQLTVGAFQACLDVDIVGVDLGGSCFTIDASCQVTLPDALASAHGNKFPPQSPDQCTAFNAFRGLLSSAILLSAIAVVTALIATCKASPSPYLGCTSVTSSTLAAVLSGISEILFNQGAVDASADFDGISISMTKGVSMWLAVSSIFLALLGLLPYLAATKYGKAAQEEGVQAEGYPAYVQGFAHPHFAVQQMPQYQVQQWPVQQYGGQGQYVEQAWVQQPVFAHPTPAYQLSQPLMQ